MKNNFQETFEYESINKVVYLTDIEINDLILRYIRNVNANYAILIDGKMGCWKNILCEKCINFRIGKFN